MKKSIYITKPISPNKKIFNKYFDEVINSGVYTNYGSKVRLLEEKLADRFKIKHVIALANGTLALEAALSIISKKNEVITSPFSFIATSSSIIRNGLKPIYADIERDSFNINPSEVLKKISNKTAAILPVHVFGNPCNLEKLSEIGKKFKVPIIYDASHCFDINFKNRSILSYGDISTISFHATKLFHTAEGGAIFTNSDQYEKQIRSFINFGFKTPTTFLLAGTNAKISEISACFGLSILDKVSKEISARKKVFEFYNKHLKEHVIFQKWNISVNNKNYMYYPVLLKTKTQRDNIHKILQDHKIFSRRYFYPSLNKVDYLSNSNFCKFSSNIANRILCLPIHSGLKKNELKIITNLIISNL